MKVFCIDINNSNYNKIKELNYIPVGLGQDNFDDNWLRDNTGVNISHKNPYYGEYTFHYWLWKNYLEKIENQEWLGFCAYRRFWSNENNKYEIKNKRDFLSRIPRVGKFQCDTWSRYIFGMEIFKDIKAWFEIFDKNPKLIFKKTGT